MACLHRIAPTVIARDLVREFGADATALGFMSSAYFYLYAAVQPPVGLLSDTWGPRAVTTLFTFIACFGVLLFGFAPNMTIATLGRGLIGIGVGGVFIPALKVFSKWFRKKEFAGITGIFLACGNAGNLTGALPLTYMVILLGWRMSFVALGVLSIFMALACWLILKNKPEDKGWPAVETDTDSPAGPAQDPSAGITTSARIKMILSRPDFWMVTVSYFFYGGPGLTFQGLWAVPYLVDVHGYSRMQAGGLLMLLPLGTIVGAPLFGFLADRLPFGRKPVLLSSLAISIGCWALILLAGGKPPAITIAPLFFIIGASGGGALSLYMTMTKELFPLWLTGTAMGLMNPAAFLSTALFQPFSGYLMDLVGRNGLVYSVEAYRHVFVAILFSMIMAFIAIMPLSKSKRVIYA